MLIDLRSVYRGFQLAPWPKGLPQLAQERQKITQKSTNSAQYKHSKIYRIGHRTLHFHQMVFNEASGSQEYVHGSTSCPFHAKTFQKMSSDGPLIQMSYVKLTNICQQFATFVITWVIIWYLPIVLNPFSYSNQVIISSEGHWHLHIYPKHAKKSLPRLPIIFVFLAPVMYILTCIGLGVYESNLLRFVGVVMLSVGLYIAFSYQNCPKSSL